MFIISYSVFLYLLGHNLVIAQNEVGAFDPSSEPSTTKSQWCKSELSVCSDLCGGNANPNTCDSNDLTYECVCTSNNSVPGLQYYTGTIPTFICEAGFEECISNAAGNAAAQVVCTNNEKENCGHLNPEFISPSVSLPGTSTTTDSDNFGSTPSTSVSSTSTAESTTTSKSSSDSNTNSPSKTNSATSSPTTGLAPSTSSSTGAAESTASSKGNSGLSTGAKAGIGVGAALFFILVCILIWLGIIGNRLLRQRKGSSQDTPHPNEAELASGGGKHWPWEKAAELIGTKLWPAKTQPPGELHAEARAEMDGTANPWATLSSPQELESGYWGATHATELAGEAGPPVGVQRKPVPGRTELG